jgi:prepilin-type processing-associated H-X9-DG protein
MLAMQIHQLSPPIKAPFRIAGRRAFTLIEIIVIIGVIALLACVLLPSLAYQRRHAKADACKDNLKQIGVAFRTSALDCGDAYPTRVTLGNGGAKERVEQGQVFFTFLVMSNEIGAPKVLACPQDSGKAAATGFNCAFSNTNVSYFVGIDAEDTFPQMFLTGDRNLAFNGRALGAGLFDWTSDKTHLSWTKAIHNEHGNIGLADGSVQFLDSAKLALAAARQSCETNRLAIP